jgi:membrane protein YdbS with pleckstrin-like domain
MFILCNKNVNQLDPKAVWLFFLNFITFGIFLATLFILPFCFVAWGSFYFLLNNSLFAFLALSYGLIVFYIAILIFGFIWSKLAYNNYKYELRDDGFRKESGVIIKSYVTIPYERIQNVDIIRGIWARIVGLSDLQIQTAGSSLQITAEGRLPGLNPDVAEKLRDELVKRARLGHQGL